ncbi:MAG: hypothetical protein JRI55_02680, partial [Deltaproteobacteria bacterium]|nr:hypothetical protein [Deltaproteobacteria bacterium]
MLRQLWTRAERSVESHVTPADAPTAAGGLSPNLLVVVGLLLLPAPLSGGARYLTAASMPACLAIATAVTLALGALWWPRRSRG